MANRARCWLCGALMTDSRCVCFQCRGTLSGLCGRCSMHDACGQRYREAAQERTRRGIDAPLYPPCTVLPVVDVTTPAALRRTQRLQHGLDVVGIVVVLLWAEDVMAHEETDRSVSLEGARELARRWGAAWRRVA